MTDANSTSDGPAAAPEMLTTEEYLARFPHDGLSEFDRKMGVQFVEASPTRLVATMPVEGNTQPFGFLHGGASVALAETLGSIGSAIHAWPDRVPVGVDINATHHRGVRPGSVVTGVATPVHVGRTTATFEVVLTDEREKRVCTARITCALVPNDRLS